MKKVFVLLSFILLSCVDQVDLLYRNEEPVLVVNGEVTSEAPPYNLRLSYSGRFVSGSIITSRLAVNGARVMLYDDLGDSVRFRQNLFEPALYQSDERFRCQIGRSYRLRVEMPDGKVYSSKPQLMRDVPPISGLSADRTKDFVRFYVEAKDPENEVNYYRWQAYSISLKTSSGGGPTTCSVSCWTYNRSEGANVYADTYTNGKEIRNRVVHYSIIDQAVPLSRHYVEVKQMSISPEAYLYWQQYEEQRARTGSIFDPLPSTIIGNMVSETSNKEFALGFFGVYGVTTRRMVAEPAALNSSSDAAVGMLPPMVPQSKPAGDCRTVYPGYGCTPPVEWN